MNELKLAEVRKTAFSALISGGKKSIEHLRDMEKKGQAVNDSLLLEILRKNARTAYGQQRGFAGIRTYEQYAAQVPLSEYQDYEDAIQRMSDLGEQNLLMSSTPDYYFLTSGTNGAPKRIPSSREQTRMIRNYLNLYRFGLVAQTLGDIWTEGATLSPVEVRVKKTDSGTLEGYFSAKLLYDLGDLVQTASLSPREVIWSEPGENTGYMHLRYGLACENVTELNAAYVTALLEMMRYLETNWQSLVRDIREGTIPEDAGYSPEKRAALLRNLRPDPERADVLEAEFQKGFEDPILPRIWRKLSLVTAAAGATFAPYLEQLRRYIGNDVQVYYHGYTASEAVMGVPVSLNSQQYELLPDSCFYEFQPYDEESGSILPFAEGAPLLRMSQLETGKAYVVIITNICGLYRYRMHDVVRVVGFRGTIPVIEFMYREGSVFSIAGEHVSETGIANAVFQTAKDTGLAMTGFSVYTDINSKSRGRYVFLIETTGDTVQVKPAELSERLMSHLKENELGIRYVAELGTMIAPVVHFLKKGAYERYRIWQGNRNMGGNQIKPPHILCRPEQIEFFLNEVEDNE